MILGAGGYSTIFQDVTDESKAIKQFKPNQPISICKDEFIAHCAIRSVFDTFIAKYPCLKEYIFVPKAYEFVFNDVNCSYTMDKITTHRNDRLAQHIVLNEDMYSAFCGKIIFTDQNTNMISMETELKEEDYVKGPRGAFLGKEHFANAKESNQESYAYHMGILYQLIKIAKYEPKDVEFILDATNRLCMIDFGMVNQKYTIMDREIDMYLPPDDTLDPSFMNGVNFVIENME